MQVFFVILRFLGGYQTGMTGRERRHVTKVPVQISGVLQVCGLYLRQVSHLDDLCEYFLSLPSNKPQLISLPVRPEGGGLCQCPYFRLPSLSSSYSSLSRALSQC